LISLLYMQGFVRFSSQFIRSVSWSWRSGPCSVDCIFGLFRWVVLSADSVCGLSRLVTFVVTTTQMRALGFDYSLISAKQCCRRLTMRKMLSGGAFSMCRMWHSITNLCFMTVLCERAISRLQDSLVCQMHSDQQQSA
jgi:hypothetical protein